MKQKSTIILATIALSILVIVAVVGFLQSSSSVPPTQTTPPAPQPPLTKNELSQKLDTEVTTLHTIITAAYPAIASLYTINTGQLYDRGQWYGTTLTYKGSDSENRDTLRVLMEKKDGVWKLRTTPPTPILNIIELPDVPKDILQSINQPTLLPGTPTSPTIN